MPARPSSSVKPSTSISTSNSLSTSNSKNEKGIPQFYAVYLLKSLKHISKIKTKKYYIGSTPAPHRRLQQHNGVLKGGAKKTANGRPWAMSLFVSGFMSPSDAVGFEWAFQHLDVSRYISVKDKQKVPQHEKKKKSYTNSRETIAEMIDGLVMLLKSDRWRRNTLHLHVLDGDLLSLVQSSLQRNNSNSISVSYSPISFNLISSNVGDIDNAGKEGIEELKRLVGSLTVSPVQSLLLPKVDECIICLQLCHPPQSNSSSSRSSSDGLNADTNGMGLKCWTGGCDAVYHLTCLADWFLYQEQQHVSNSSSASDLRELIPVKGRCPKCRGFEVWSSIVRQLISSIPTGIQQGQPELEAEELELEEERGDVIDLLSSSESDGSSVGSEQY